MSSSSEEEKKDKNDSDDVSSHGSFNDKSSPSDSNTESDLSSSNDSDDNSDESDEVLKQKRELKKQKFMSKFFVDVNSEEELDNDIPDKILEAISEDEQTESREQILKERNKKKS